MNNKSSDPFGIIEGFADLKPGVPTSEEQELIGQLQNKILHAEQSRKPREQAWEFNLVNLKGEQVLARNPINGDIVRVTMDDQEAELPSHDNILLTTHRAFVGKMTRIIPSCIVMPRTEDRTDTQAAEVLDSHLDYKWRSQKLKKKYKRAMDSLSWAGIAVHQLCWDRDKGREIAFCPQCKYGFDTLSSGDQCPACAMQLELQQQAMMQGQMPVEPSPPSTPSQLIPSKEGDSIVEVIDPRMFYPQPGVTEIENMEWCLVRKALPVAKLRRMFPDKADVIQEEDNITTDRSVTFSREFIGVQVEYARLQGHAYLREIYEAPSGKYPDGRIIFFCNDRVLEVRKNYYYTMFGRFNFFIYRADRYDGEFWGGAPIDQAWHLQRERDVLMTQKREHRELTLNPKVLVGTNSGVDVDRFTTTAGEVIKVRPNPMGKPTFMQVPAMPPHVYQESDILAQAIRDKFGVTPHEAGQSGADESGRYVAMLESQASEAVAPWLIEIFEEWLELMRCMLILDQKCYAPDRKWAIRGYDYPKSYSWDQVDIKDGWDLALADEDSLSKNPAMRLQQAMMLLDKGAFVNVSTGIPDMKKFFRYANLRMPGAGPDLDAQHRAYAAAIPDMIARGAFTGPKPWDDAVACCEEMVEWLRGPGLHAPEPLVREVFTTWTIYAQALNPQNPLSAGLTPNPILAGQMGQPGQVPSQGQQTQAVQQNAGPGTGSSTPSAPQVQQAPDVNQQVQQADRRAETVARGSLKQEGASTSY